MTARPCIPPPPPERETDPDLLPAGCRETPLPMAAEGEMACWYEDEEERR